MARKKKLTPLEAAKVANEAHTDLNIYHAIIALLEGGLMSSDDLATQQRIITTCKNAGHRALQRMDAALAKVDSSYRYAP